VDALLDSLTAYDLAEWMAYFAAEPWGEERADLRAGIVASTLANIHRGATTQAFSPRDFMPYAHTVERYISEEEIEAKLDNFMRKYH
jgi:hypothetical protein